IYILMTIAPRAPRLALFPYTTLFRSGGEIVVSPGPLPRHSKAQGSARRFLGGPFDDDDGRGGPGGWWIFVEVDVALTPHDIVRRSEEHTSELQSRENIVCRLLLEKKK